MRVKGHHFGRSVPIKTIMEANDRDLREQKKTLPIDDFWVTSFLIISDLYLLNLSGYLYGNAAIQASSAERVMPNLT